MTFNGVFIVAIVLVWIITIMLLGFLLIVVSRVVLMPLFYVPFFILTRTVSFFIDKQTSTKKKEQKIKGSKMEDQALEAVKEQFGWTDKYGDSYVSSRIGKVLWVDGDQWMLFDDNEITEYSVVERKRDELANDALGRAIAGPRRNIQAGDVIERLGVIFTVVNGARYEILEYEGSERASKMEGAINRHNRLIREFDEIVNTTK